MKSQYAEKVLLPTDSAVSTLTLAPAAVPPPNGSVSSQSTGESRRLADAERLPRWGPKKNILETAAACGLFKTLGRALEDTHLTDMLSETGPFTVFAPTDAAFAKMPSADLRALLADKAKLRSVLTHHIVASKVRAPRERAPNTATTVDGRKLTMTVEHGFYKVDDVQIVKTNLRASNGLIHAIDSVLLPR
jgi:uncharacterized surface protein with fasciclin (FAS1) repeats